MSVPLTAIEYNVGLARTTAPTSMDGVFGRSNVRAGLAQHLIDCLPGDHQP
jgi:hypothetical protein